MKKNRKVVIIKDGNPETFPELGMVFDGSSEFQWCLHCERVSKKGHYKLVPRGSLTQKDFKMDYWVLCPFDDCDGAPMWDIWDWDSLRESRKDLPENPEEGKEYPLYK